MLRISYVDIPNMSPQTVECLADCESMPAKDCHLFSFVTDKPFVGRCMGRQTHQRNDDEHIVQAKWFHDALADIQLDYECKIIIRSTHIFLSISRLSATAEWVVVRDLPEENK